MADVDGPIFDGRAENACREFVDKLLETVASDGEQLVRDKTSIFRRPTGYYESQIRKTQIGDGWIIHDGGVVYGPWLEGVGSRNSPVTVFPGYFMYQRSRDELDLRVDATGERVLIEYLPRMG